MSWRYERESNSLAESFSTVKVPQNAGFWRKFFAFFGPGLMISVGYMDPGNWATDIEGGAKFGYTLLFVILLSNFFAIILQHLSVKLGIATERDLAQACRGHYSKPVNFVLWLFCEIAIAAMDLAEVIGTAIALNLLFGVPLTYGVIITIIDVFIILMLQKRGFRWLEVFIASLVFLVLACFAYEVLIAQPNVQDLLSGFIPKKEIIENPQMLFIAVGILGATVMPHNLYLHSSIIQTRAYERTEKGKKEAIKFASLDSTLSLLLAFFINAAILILAAATFHGTPYSDIADIGDAHQMLEPLLGTSLAGIAFAVALLASGQNSTLTGTLAGQIVMEGFLNLKIKPWLRRMITRLIAVIPAFFVTLFAGEKGTAELLIWSQVILSLQLPFAVFPLIQFTNDSSKMGNFTNAFWLKIMVWIIGLIILFLNVYLVFHFFTAE
ncbi:Nramp family divalent metal transporter [Bergeyella zoohelcum]|uniref:Divalent metal cation transporter MntH n=1 Tax=Bergeyella zoohelcum TaxID=1015 RepID=A0A7Z8YQE3_9FLAO|nr:Nramp family divalent metal transporter [Bergeyella zoohelcum]VDH05338.1 Probable manganese transport protein MntH [Bergeyella zoohelcum]